MYNVQAFCVRMHITNAFRYASDLYVYHAFELMNPVLYFDNIQCEIR
jgi:hypothetical protein